MKKLLFCMLLLFCLFISSGVAQVSNNISPDDCHFSVSDVAFRAYGIPTKIWEGQVFPYKFVDILRIKINKITSDELLVYLMDASNKMGYQTKLPLDPSNEFVELQLPESLSNGTYFLKAHVGEKQQTLPVILIR